MIETVSVANSLERSPLFATLTPGERASLAAAMFDVRLERGQMLFSRGDSSKDIYLVIEGRIRFSVLSTEGREISFSHAVAGDVFGEIAALEDTSRSTDAIAITRAHLKVIKQSTFRDLLTRNASFSFGIIQLLCSRLRDLSKHYEAVGLLPVEVRVARLLCELLYEKKSAKREEVHTLRLDLSQNELGLLVGTTRQRANAALTALERAGAIERSARRLTCNEEKLRKFAQFDCP